MYRFKRKERLKRTALIRRMFNREGQTVAAFPLRLIWLETSLDTDVPAQFTLSVPKRAFPKAAHRNRIRRQLREAYRLNKHKFYKFIKGREEQYALMILYTGKKPAPYKQLDKKVNELLKKFKDKVDKS
ncbi:MAG: ribonuclease P protein component [Bacteroidota bacterium]